MVNLHSLWGHLVTILAGLGASLGDTGVISLGHELDVAVTAVAALLGAVNVITGAQMKKIQQTAAHDLPDIAARVQHAVTALTEPTPPAQG